MTGQRTPPPGVTPPSALPSACVVQLRYATLPRVLGSIAVHYWFAVLDQTSGQGHRWEVWQAKDAGGKSFGHVHCDLRHPDCGVGGGAYRLAVEWAGSAARTICSVLTKAQEYPYKNRYCAWPGPNSNTFVAWVLREAGLQHSLDPRAIGKDYLGLLGMRLSSRPACAQLETPFFGVKLSLRDGVELHLLCLTCGLRWPPLEVHTPFGRVGVLKTAGPARNARPDTA